MNLETTAQSLLEQFPQGERPDLMASEKMLELFGKVAFGGFGIVLVLAVVGSFTQFSRTWSCRADNRWLAFS
jgi:hypothetical protein